MNNISNTELKSFVENNPKLVSRKESKRYPGLFVLKYTKAVFYDYLWNHSPFLLECRGLVVDEYYNIVVKPFTKVFNYGENGTYIEPDEVCQWARKVNGFLGVATYNKCVSDDLIYSTTGSLDSEFVDLVAKYIDPIKQDIISWASSINENISLMFEICDESDPHIIPETSGAWLIGCNINGQPQDEYALDSIAECLSLLRPACGIAKFSDIKEMANACDHEGYMVYGKESGTALKIKSHHYLITKLIARAGDKKLAGMASSNYVDVKKRFDEEYYPLVDYLSTITSELMAMDEQTRIQHIREFLRNN